MNLRRILYSVTILMTVALFGLLVVQFLWIRESYRLKKDNFDQMVRTTINKTLQKESYRSQIVELTEILPEIIDDSVRYYFNSVKKDRVFLPEGSNSKEHRDSANAFVYVSQNSWRPDEDESVTIVSSGDNTTMVKISVNSDGGHEVITDAGSGKLQVMKHELDEGHAELDAIRAEMHERIAQEYTPAMEEIEKAGKLIEKMAIEYSYKHTGSMNRVVPQELCDAIGAELKKKGIGIDFMMSIYDPEADSSVWNSISDASLNPTEGTYEFDLFPDDIIEKPEKLQISFPNRERYILGTMWLMMLTSLLITGLVVSAGVYSVRTLFRQKRLADIKSDFINNMTHEFKTPISTISVAADSLVNDSVANDSEKVRYYAEIIGEENRKMNSNVENILQLALFDRGEVQLNMRSLDLNDLIKDSVRSFELRIKDLSGTIRMELAEDLPEVNVDPAYFAVVMNNLIDNAIKYSGSEPPDVLIRTELIGDSVRFSVIDHGIGMSPDEQRNIFEKFYRVSGGVIHDVKGFGLGLSYVKMIAEAHGGSVRVDSRKGKGSAFSVNLRIS